MEELLTHISSLYNLQLHSAEKVTKGFLSENYVLFSNNKKYFLKRYRFDTKDRIEEIHLAKKYFADKEIPVILPIPTNEDSMYFFFNNGYYALFPFIEDKQLEKDTLSDSAITSLGKMMGRIHLCGREAKLPIKERFKIWNKNKTLEKVELILREINKLPQLTKFDKQALEKISLKKKLIQANSISYEDLHLPNDHLIHGDYLDHNVFFNFNDEVSYVFDFEKTDYSPRMYEVFRSLMYTLLSDEFTEDNIQKARIYLKAYLSVYPTTKDELLRGLRLFYVKSIHGFWVESEHYLNKNNRVDEFLTEDFYRIQYLSEHYQEFESMLLDK